MEKTGELRSDDHRTVVSRTLSDEGIPLSVLSGSFPAPSGGFDVSTPAHPPLPTVNDTFDESPPPPKKRVAVVLPMKRDYHACAGEACDRAGTHFPDHGTLSYRSRHVNDPLTAREAELRRKVTLLDGDDGLLSLTEEAELLLLQAEKRIRAAVRLVRESVEDTLCRNSTAATTTTQRAYDRSVARDRSKAVADFAIRHLSSLDMTVWGTDSVVGRIISDACEVPAARRARQRESDGRPTLRRWIDAAGHSKATWKAHDVCRAALVVELCMMCAHAAVGQESVHAAMQIFDRVACVWEVLLAALQPDEAPLPDTRDGLFYDFGGMHYKKVNLDWQVRVVAYAVLRAVQPMRAEKDVFAPSYLAACVRFFSRARRGEEGETVFPPNPSCFLDEYADCLTCDVADFTSERDRVADYHFDAIHRAETVKPADVIEGHIVEVADVIADVCREEMRRPTIFAIGSDIIRTAKSAFAATAFHAVALSYLMQGHLDEVAYGPNQEDVFRCYMYPRRGEMAAGLVAVARSRSDPTTVPWGEDCVAATGLSVECVAPVARRMNRYTQEVPAAPYEWQTTVARFIGCPSVAHFDDLVDMRAEGYKGTRRPVHPYLAWNREEEDAYFTNQCYMVTRHNLPWDGEEDVDVE